MYYILLHFKLLFYIVFILMFSMKKSLALLLLDIISKIVIENHLIMQV